MGLETACAAGGGEYTGADGDFMKFSVTHMVLPFITTPMPMAFQAGSTRLA